MAFGDFLTYLRLVASVFLLWTAWWVGRAPYQERPNRLLAIFLAVLATGFLLEFISSLFWVPGGGPTRAFSNLSFILGLIDPLVLLAFALTTARPTQPMRRMRAIVPPAIVAVAILAWAAESDFVVWGPSGPWLSRAHLLYVNGTYLAAFAFLVHAFDAESRRYRLAQLRVLAIAVGFAALSRSTAYFWPWPLWPVPTDVLAPLALLAAVGLLGIVWLVFSLRPRAPRAATHRLFLTLLGLLVVFFLAWWLIIWLAQKYPPGTPALFYFYSTRWIIFTLLMAHGVLRHQLFDYDLRVRYAVGLLVSLLGGLAIALVVGPTLERFTPSLLVARLGGLAAGAFGLLAGYAITVRLLRGSPRSLPIEHHDSRRIEIYEATLEYVLHRPAATREELIYVETLREVFAISPEEHDQVLERLQRSGPQARVRDARRPSVQG